MRYAVAIWNYASADTPLAATVDEFANFGYDTISFTTAHLIRLPAEVVRDAAQVIEDRDLMVTMHGNFEPTIQQVAGCIEPFAERLLCLSCDAAMVSEPRGRLYDTETMAPFLGEVLSMTEGTRTRVAIEDFPLDQSAVDAYREDLAPLMEDPRYGILIDVGHMNMRLTQERYFAGMSEADYLAGPPLPIVEVHLHDNDGQRDQHGHFGMGTVRFGAVAQALKAVGFDGVSTVEIAPGLHGADPRATKHHAADALRQWRELWEGEE